MENKFLSLFAGFLAMAFVIIAYFVKKKEYYLLFQLLCIISLILSYFFNVQFFAMIGLTVGMTRTLTFYIFENKGQVAPLYLSFLFSALTIISYFIVNYGILKTAQPLDVLCLIALCMYAFIFRVRNLKFVRFAMIVPTVLSILFNILTSAAIFATMSYVIELVATVVAIFKFHVFNKEEKQA